MPRKIFLRFAVIVLLAPAFAFSQVTDQWSNSVSPLPAPTGFVNDYAGVIDAATKQQIEAKIKELSDTTDPKVELAVAVVKTTGDRPIFDYSLAVARGWKIGSKSDDNPSALLLVAIDDRKYFTQVSRDLEDELPDGAVGQLQRQYLVPEFRKGNYGKGISDTIDAYINTIRNKGNVAAPTPTPGVGSSESSSGLVGFFCCAAILLIIIVIYFSSRNRGGPSSGDRKRWGGGAFGANDGGASSALPWIIGGILSGGGGSSGSSSSSDWGGSSGGDWGGFGGGGDFGGGGGGGDW